MPLTKENAIATIRWVLEDKSRHNSMPVRLMGYGAKFKQIDDDYIVSMFGYTGRSSESQIAAVEDWKDKAT